MVEIEETSKNTSSRRVNLNVILTYLSGIPKRRLHDVHLTSTLKHRGRVKRRELKYFFDARMYKLYFFFLSWWLQWKRTLFHFFRTWNKMMIQRKVRTNLILKSIDPHDQKGKRVRIVVEFNHPYFNFVNYNLKF